MQFLKISKTLKIFNWKWSKKRICTSKLNLKVQNARFQSFQPSKKIPTVEGIFNRFKKKKQTTKNTTTKKNPTNLMKSGKTGCTYELKGAAKHTTSAGENQQISELLFPMFMNNF